MSDAYDYPDADAIPPVKPNATHALTREQVEAGMFTREQLDKALALIFHKGTPAMQEVVMEVLAHDGALRQALAQQAQEVERLNKLIKERSYRDEANATVQLQLLADKAKRIDDLKQQLAAMRAERDAYKAVLQGAEYEQVDRIGALPVEVARQLGEAAAQRTKEIIVDLATLQATLAEREGEVNQLNNVLRQAGWGQGEIDSAAYTFDKMAEANRTLVKERDTARQDATRLRDGLDMAAKELHKQLCVLDTEHHTACEQVQRALKGA